MSKDEPKREAEVKPAAKPPTVPAIIEEHCAIDTSRKQTLPTAASSRRIANKVNHRVDAETTRYVIDSIIAARESGDYQFRTSFIPDKLKEQLLAKGYRISKGDGDVTITWESAD